MGEMIAQKDMMKYTALLFVIFCPHIQVRSHVTHLAIHLIVHVEWATFSVNILGAVFHTPRYVTVAITVQTVLMKVPPYVPTKHAM
jgi:hypothetical protein